MRFLEEIMSNEALLGIVISVVFGVAAFFVAKSIRSKRQSQRAESGSTAYQAGRDINQKS